MGVNGQESKEKRVGARRIEVGTRGEGTWDPG